MDLVQGGVDSRGGYISKILYVKMKESGPLGGRAPGIRQCRYANGLSMDSKPDPLLNSKLRAWPPDLPDLVNYN